MTPTQLNFLVLCNIISVGASKVPVDQYSNKIKIYFSSQFQYVDEDAFGLFLDSESAIEELSRQILSEAKLWEAIQEASAEIARRKQKEAY